MNQLRRILVALGLIGAAPLATSPAAAQQPTISGRVTSQDGGQPVVGARVAAVGTTAVTQTNADGRYVLRQAGTGSVRVRINAIGFQSTTIVVDLGSGPATADVELIPAVVQLNEIVTTAVGEQNRLEVPNAIGTIAADSVARLQPVNNVSDVLNSRVPGVNVSTETGAVGGSTRIRVRGANSISLSNEPVFIVDGAYINSGTNTFDNFTGGQGASRLNDAVNPDDIESIEVVKGPSASTLYGSAAANGVIVIKTKRGRAGRPTWNFSATGGINQDKNDYPLNYNAYGVRGSNPASRPNCYLFRRADGSCSQFDSLVTTNPLRDPLTSPLTTGNLGALQASVSGGTDQVRYYFGGEFSHDVGVWRLPDAEIDSIKTARGISEVPYDQLRPNTSRTVSLRSSITADVAPRVQLQANFGYTQSKVRLPQNDNNILGVLGNALLAPGDPAAATPWAFGIGPAASFAIVSEQPVDRFLTSLSSTWTPTSRISARLSLGLDRINRSDNQTGVAGEAPAFDVFSIGSYTRDKFNQSSYSIDGSVAWRADLAQKIRSTFTVGGQFVKTTLNATLATGNGIVPGSNRLAGAQQQLIGDSVLTNASGGIFLDEQIGINERLFLNAAVRFDQASAFQGFKKASVLPKAGASYVLRDERNSTLGLVRLRAAYGQSLVAPGPLSALRTLTAINSVRPVAPGSDVGQDVSTVTTGSAGNLGLKPERSREFEGGIDAAFFGERLTLGLTLYDKQTKDALVNRPLAPSLGSAQFQFVNVAKVKNQGLELGLDAQVLRGKTLALDVGLTGSLLKNRVEDLGEGVSPFQLGFAQRMVAGFPAGGYWENRVIINNPNPANGILGINDITVEDSLSYVGPVLPTREFTLSPTIGLFNRRIRINSQWNYRGGNYLDNSTEYFRCLFANCRAFYDASASLEDQARALAQAVDGRLLTDVRKADFLRLREVSVTFTAPDRLARTFGAGSLSLTLAGRNLALWTKYPGVDPETNNFGAVNFDTSDFLTQAPLRSWFVRINMGF